MTTSIDRMVEWAVSGAPGMDPVDLTLTATEVAATAAAIHHILTPDAPIALADILDDVLERLDGRTP